MKTFTLTEEELNAIVQTVVDNTTRDSASAYAILLALEIEGKGMTGDQIVTLFEDDEGEIFPETHRALAERYNNRRSGPVNA